MLSGIGRGNVDSLRAWQTVIRVLGSAIHVSGGTSTLNSLLSIAEKGFKSDADLMRRETFYSWEILINNFAMSETVLNHPKRVRLVTRPLVVSSEI